MPDSPEDIRRVKAGPMLGGKGAKIGPQPEPSFSRKALEMLTGYPADPMRNMGPMDGVQMLGTALGAPGALRGLQAGGQALMGRLASRAPAAGPRQLGGNAAMRATEGITDIPMAIQTAARAGDSAQDMLNPRAQDMMRRMGDEVGRTSGWLSEHTPSTARVPKDYGAQLPPSTHPKGVALEMLRQATAKASRGRTGIHPEIDITKVPRYSYSGHGGAPVSILD